MADVKLRHVFVLAASLLCVGCASVPKQAEELSATIGRDLASVESAHRKLAQILFARMRSDINRFVDEVYAPHQIQIVMARQKELAVSSDPGERRKSLLLAINSAFESNASPDLQGKVIKSMGIMVQGLREDIELMRQELLSPLDSQEIEVLGSIDRAYLQLHYANSIVTGHLASVVKVHETQAELLNTIGVDRDLPTLIGKALSSASDRIAGLVNTAEKAGSSLEQAEETARHIKEQLNSITSPKN